MVSVNVIRQHPRRSSGYPILHKNYTTAVRVRRREISPSAAPCPVTASPLPFGGMGPLSDGHTQARLHQLVAPQGKANKRVRRLGLCEKALDRPEETMQLVGGTGRQELPEHPRVVETKDEGHPVFAIDDVELSQMSTQLVKPDRGGDEQTPTLAEPGLGKPSRFRLVVLQGQ